MKGFQQKFNSTGIRTTRRRGSFTQKLAGAASEISRFALLTVGILVFITVMAAKDLLAKEFLKITPKYRVIEVNTNAKGSNVFEAGGYTFKELDLTSRLTRGTFLINGMRFKIGDFLKRVMGKAEVNENDAIGKTYTQTKNRTEITYTFQEGILTIKIDQTKKGNEVCHMTWTGVPKPKN